MDKEHYWSRYADDFEERVDYITGKQIVDEILSTLAAQDFSGKVLEIGCGNATYSEILASKAEQLYATDFSDQMVAFSKNRLKHLPSVVVEKQNCFALSYLDSSFDVVVLINLLHVISEPERALREGKRVLKPNGMLIAASLTTEGMGLFGLVGMTFRYLRAFGKPPANARRLTVISLRAMLEGEGFHVEEAKLIGDTAKAVFSKAANHVAI
jgi:ubiquinone/menaquinone biosynthesis C-methylase UbiE